MFGLSFWLDATQIVGATNNQALTSWNDASPNAYSGSAINGPLYITNAINSNPVVRFNGSNQYINFGTSALNIGTNHFNTFVVARYSTINSNGAIMSKSLAGGAGYRYFVGKVLGATNYDTFFTNSGDANNFVQVPYNVSTPNLLGSYWNRSNVFGALNGSTLAALSFINSENFTTSFNLIVGAYNNSGGGIPPSGQYIQGDIAEIVTYLYPFTPFDRQKIEGYLAWKWGLQTSLPLIHPFRSAAPRANTVFSPSSISSLQIWFDMADPLYYAISGSTITALTDKSGAGNSATTIGGSPRISSFASLSTAILFNGTNTFFSGPYVNRSSQLTAFVVGTMGGTTQINARLFSIGVSNANDYSSASFGGIYRESANAKIGFVRTGGLTSVDVAFDTPFILCKTFTGTSYSTILNGGTASGSLAFSGNFSTSRFGFGRDAGNVDGSAPNFSYAYWGGRVGEVLVYNAALPLTDRQTVEGYLAWKWGLQGNLPTSHPYKELNPALLYNISSFATNFNNGNDINLMNYSTSNLSTLTPTGSGRSYRAPSPVTSSNILYKQNYVPSTNTVSFCASIYRTGSLGYGPILMTRTPGLAQGLTLTQSGTNIGYHWLDNINTYNYDTGVTIPLNTWRHIVLTISPTRAQWYVNGALVHTHSNTLTPYPISNVAIGTDPNVGGNRAFPGLIDNVAFYTTTLGASTISSIYASTLLV
jgi:hypothetical protein